MFYFILLHEIVYSCILCQWLIDHKFVNMGFPGGLDGEDFACNAGDPGLIPGFGRSPGEGNG